MKKMKTTNPTEKRDSVIQKKKIMLHKTKEHATDVIPNPTEKREYKCTDDKWCKIAEILSYHCPIHSIPEKRKCIEDCCVQRREFGFSNTTPTEYCKFHKELDTCEAIFRKEKQKVKPTPTVESWERELEQILIEWEGKDNAILGAVRVLSRTKRLEQFISSQIQQAEERLVEELYDITQDVSQKPEEMLGRLIARIDRIKEEHDK